MPERTVGFGPAANPSDRTSHASLPDPVPADQIDGDAGTRPRFDPGRRLRLATCLLVLAIGITLVGWMLATPLVVAPDEPSHVVQATAIVRGQFDRPHVTTKIGELSYVQVPAWVRQVDVHSCVALHPALSSECPKPVARGRVTATMPTQFSNYPPFYFLWVGLPSLVTSGAPAVYVMRLFAVLANTALLGLGLALLLRYHPRRLPLAAALVAITPMVLFLASVLNTSGLEISAALAAWCGGLCIVAREDVPIRLAVWTSVAFVVFAWSRPISPVNVAVVVGVLAVLAGRVRLRTMWAGTGTRVVACAVAGAVAVAAVLLMIGGSPDLLGFPTKPPLSFGAAFHLVVTLDPSLLRQAIGNFGSLNDPVPSWVAAAWTAMVAVLCAVGLVRSPRCRLALPLLVLAILAMPVIFEIPQINAVGAFWQGRYWLPLLVGIPLVAATGQARRAHTRPRVELAPRTATAVTAGGMVALGGLVAGAQVAAFLFALHSYTTGLGAPGARWTPPGGSGLVIAIFVSGEVLLVATVSWLVTSRRDRSGDGPASLAIRPPR